jgi:glycosyltransferase involved in cell wall biosynthesis
LKLQAKYSFHLNIVGDGGYLAESKKIVENLEINDQVSFIGAINDKVEKQKWFEDSDIYILPTYHEGFPRTLYEAMIYGTPIITTLVGGIPALMKDGVNCLAIEKQSVKSIVEKLNYAMNHYDEMIQYALTAKETVFKVVDSHRPTHAQDVDQAIRSLNKR